MATSGTQLTFEKEQPKHEDTMGIQELVEKYMKEQENMATMSFEGQHESLPYTLGLNKKEENLSYNWLIRNHMKRQMMKLQRLFQR